MDNIKKINSNIKNRLFTMSEYTKHSGMIGWLRSDTYKADYVYGEITGYFLSFCAYVYRQESSPNVKKYIESIIYNHVNWLDLTINTGLKTRYVYGSYDDWRNNAIFAFDLAMIVRGLDDVKEIVPVSSVIAKYVEMINKCVASSNVLTSVYSSNSILLPRKWSTTFDIHLVKAVANLNGIENWDNSCTKNTFDALKNIMFEDLIKKDSHPLFYYLEGILLLIGKKVITDTKMLDYVKSIYVKLLNIGILFNNSSTKEYIRSDVLSQLIRIGSLLYSYRKLSDKDFCNIEKTVNYLVNNFYDDGYICFFEKDNPENFYNTWSAMFAYQAIDLFLKAKENVNVPTNADFFYQSIY